MILYIWPCATCGFENHYSMWKSVKVKLKIIQENGFFGINLRPFEPCPHDSNFEVVLFEVSVISDVELVEAQLKKKSSFLPIILFSHTKLNKSHFNKTESTYAWNMYWLKYSSYQFSSSKFDKWGHTIWGIVPTAILSLLFLPFCFCKLAKFVKQKQSSSLDFQF